MRYLFQSIIILLLINNSVNAQNKIELKESFSRLIVSPHIETVFVKGDVASIEIKEITVPLEKLKYEYYNNNTLQVYLEGAQTYTESNKDEYTNIKKPIYEGTIAKVIITYTDVSVFSLRGEEEAVFESTLTQDKCTIRFYGDSKAIIKDINVNELVVDIYGDSFVTIEKGTINTQKVRAYGGSVIKSSKIVAKVVKITAYGDGYYEFNASDTIKVTAFGNAKIMYLGEAELKKGLVVGNTSIKKM